MLCYLIGNKLMSPSRVCFARDGIWWAMSLPLSRRTSLFIFFSPPVLLRRGSQRACGWVPGCPPRWTHHRSPQAAVLHKLLQCECCPCAAVLQELLWHGSLPWPIIHEEQTAPSMASPQATVFARKHASCVGFSPWAAAFLRASPSAAAWGPAHRFQCGYVLHGLQGHSLPHCGLIQRLQGNPCSGTWSTSSPSFSDAGVRRAVSLTLSSLLSHTVLCSIFHFS